jgi:hypothetical protein
MISFLKKEEDKESKFMGRGDIIFLAVILALVGGFWYYSKSIRSISESHFASCDKVFTAKHYLTDSLDSIIYSRSEFISELTDKEVTLFNKADSAMARLDSAGAFALVKDLPEFYFLDSAKVGKLKTWSKLANPIKDSLPVETTK